MAKVTFIPTFNYVDDTKKLSDLIAGFLGQLTSEFNGQLDFGTNIRSSALMGVTFLSSSIVVPVTHSLRTIPSGILMMKQDAAGSVYAPTGAQYAWTSRQIYLQASAAMNVSLYVMP